MINYKEHITDITMSKQTQTSEDFYDVYKKNIEKYFESMENTNSQYFHEMANIQSECAKTCRNTITSALSLQQEFAKKTGMDTNIPEAVKNVIIDSNKQIIKARTVQNQIAQATTNVIQKNIKTWNDNADSLADLNRNTLQSWISSFTQA